MRPWIIPILTLTTALAMTLDAWVRFVPIHRWFAPETSASLAACPLEPKGVYFIFDIHRLPVTRLCDDRTLWPDEFMGFCENGRPLIHTRTHADVEKQPGHYYIQNNTIVFQPWTQPTAEFTLHYVPMPFIVRRLCWLVEHQVFVIVLAASVLGLVALRRSAQDTQRAGRCERFLGLALLAALAAPLAHDWDRVVLSADSASYIHDFCRPPLYPAFLRLCGVPAKVPVCNASGDVSEPAPALQRAAQIQKLIYVAGICFLAFSLATAMSTPLAVLSVYVLFAGNLLNPQWSSWVMSESLALSLLLVLVGGFVRLVMSRRLGWLLVIAAACAGAILDRSASAFSIAIVIVSLILSAIYHRRRLRSLLAVYAGVGAIAGLSLVWLVGHVHATMGVWTPAPFRNWQRVAFAIQVAEESDATLLADPMPREFLVRCLARRRDVLRQYPAEDRGEDVLSLNVNVWYTAVPMGLSLLNDDRPLTLPPTPRMRTVYAQFDQLFGSVSDVVLPRHRQRYWRIVRESFFREAIGEATRLRWKTVHCLVPGLVGLLLCVLAANRCGLLGLVILATHFLNLFMICLVENALERYVKMTEWLFILGMFLAVIAAVQRLRASICRTETRRVDTAVVSGLPFWRQSSTPGRASVPN